MTQGIVWRKIVGLGGRPEFWLLSLLLWAMASAGRSLGTPWAAAAGTEALRWAGGIGLALALGWGLRRTEIAGRFLVLLTGAMALFGILGGDAAQNGVEQGGLVGPYHDHQLYGSVLLLLLPFAAAAALAARSASWRWGALAALAAGTLCLFLSETRSAWIGLAAAGLVFGGLRWKQLPPRVLPQKAVLIPLALLCLGLLCVWLLGSPADQKTALFSRAGSLLALGQDGSWQSRLELWRGTARLVVTHPALGIGLGRYPGAEWAWTHTGGLLAPVEHPSLTNQAHSFYGQTAAEIGLPGLFLYLAALLTLAGSVRRRLRQRRRSLNGQTALVIAALSALAGQSVDALASPSWQFPEASFLFWAVFGLGLALLRRGEAQPAPAHTPPSLIRLGQWAASGALAVVLTAQVLPIGLLTPVEAYSHPSSSVYQSVAVNQAACTSGSGDCFSLTATYSTGPADVTFDSGSGTGIPSAFTCRLVSTAQFCVSKFGTGTARNQLTVSQSEKGMPMRITGTFEDASVPPTGSPTYTGRTSPPFAFTP